MSGSSGRGRRQTHALTDRGSRLFAEARPAAYGLLQGEVTGLNPQQTQVMNRKTAMFAPAPTTSSWVSISKPWPKTPWAPTVTSRRAEA